MRFFTRQSFIIISLLFHNLGEINIKISIDITADEIEALMHLSENKTVSSFVDKVLRESEKVATANIMEARTIQEINPYSLHDS